MLELIGKQAKEASVSVSGLGTALKNDILLEAASLLEKEEEILLAANEKDRRRAVENGMAAGLLDRLTLTPERIHGIADGLRQVAALEDPIGAVSNMKRRPNGLLIGKMSVPIGVIGVIYEARPNVTADVFALCFKTGNVTVLKGGSDAISSNTAIVKVLQEALKKHGVTEHALQLIEDTSRETAREFMHLGRYIDLLIPRGGAGLIRTVVKESTIPVIETGTGNCHVYVDESADLEMAVKIIFNAKTQRIGVCNAEESLLVHRNVREKLLPMLEKKLSEKDVELRADPEAAEFLQHAVPATEEDWGKEYLDYILSIKTVGSVEEAIAHINRYNTGHSESIITENYDHAQKFLREVDAACVYVNASTRFTDGFEFGFGAEIGISTQKLHARGPMGLEALTSTKYIIYGEGQIRE
ncbi:MAG: glutamate-5-semialdehyde dehydrogenase [Lachnospiraceae bacterium]|nr:glutamate-5-semialdehyde dehydrogenase [Lachnospiraceae bacterium]